MMNCIVLKLSPRTLQNTIINLDVHSKSFILESIFFNDLTHSIEFFLECLIDEVIEFYDHPSNIEISSDQKIFSDNENFNY